MGDVKREASAEIWTSPEAGKRNGGDAEDVNHPEECGMAMVSVNEITTAKSLSPRTIY